MPTSVPLLLLALSTAVHSYVTTCQEIQAGNHPPFGYSTVCIVMKEASTVDTDVLRFSDGSVSRSFTSIAASTGHCITTSNSWTYQNSTNPKCKANFIVLLSHSSINVVKLSKKEIMTVSMPTGSTTFVSVRGEGTNERAGIRLSGMNSDTGTTTSFYSGVGTTSNELFSMASYSSANLPNIYYAYEAVITVKCSGGTTRATVVGNVEEPLSAPQAFGVGKHMVVTSSSRASNLQISDWKEFDFAISTPNMTVTVMPIMTAFKTGYVGVWADGDRHHEIRAGSPSFTLNVQKTIGFEYKTGSNGPWRDDESFVVSMSASASPQPSKCTCNSSKVWVDVIFLVDASAAMNTDGLPAANAMVKSVLFNLNLAPRVDGKFYTRAAVATYGNSAKMEAGFSQLTSADAVSNLKLTYNGDNDVDIIQAFQLALNTFNRNMDGKRVALGTKKVVVLLASAYKNGDYKIVHQFQEAGGTVIAIDYLQLGGVPLSGLQNLSTPGYFFETKKGSSDISFLDIIKAFCDINCFCPARRESFAEKLDLRKIPVGGCFEPYPTTDVAAAAAGPACQDMVAKLPSIHNNATQQFITRLFAPMTKFWIGFVKQNGRWTWADGSSDPFTNWAKGEPKPNNGDCAYSLQYWGLNTAWYTANCFTEPNVYACESAPCSSTNYCKL